MFTHDGRVFRTLGGVGGQAFTLLRKSGLYDELAASGKIVETSLLSAGECHLPIEVVGEAVLEHEKVPFISYPYEWSFDMLRDAALLTLDVLDASLRHGLVLKDATPFNVQFHNGKPVWIDVLSFVPYTEGSPWVAYSQFCSMQLYPLLLTAYRAVEYHPLLRGSLSGMKSSDMARILGAWRDAFRPGVLKHVWLPARFAQSFSDAPVDLQHEFRSISFTREQIHRLADNLRSTVAALRYRPRQQQWLRYADGCSYTSEDVVAKARFVAEALEAAQPIQVWDVGCNTGHYTEIAGRLARTVVGLDVDAGVINALYLRQKSGALPPNIYGLVGDLTDPSPSLGWNLVERRTWKDRGQADFFLALALVHHLALRGNVPLAMVVDGLAEIAGRGVVEFVPKDDPMVRRMLMNREDVFADYTGVDFERQVLERFEIRRRMSLATGGRTLYELARRPAET